jgi:molybdenum cofactor synthesis domain-containing protein
VALITVSDRSARGEREDRTGPRLATAVEAAGHVVVHRGVVSDDEDALVSLLVALADGDMVDPPPDLVITAGGTGVAPRDRAPEALTRAAERLVPGIGEAIRAESRPLVPTAALSRALAGVRGRTLLVALPGSPGGASDGWAVVAPLAGHVRDQLHGGDHPA